MALLSRLYIRAPLRELAAQALRLRRYPGTEQAGERPAQARRAVAGAKRRDTGDVRKYGLWFLEAAPFRHRSAHVAPVFRLWRNSENSGKILLKFRQDLAKIRQNFATFL